MKVRTVVVGTDGSDNARSALYVAAEIVADDGVVHVVSAYEPPSARAATAILASLPAEFRDTYDPFAPVHQILQEAADLFHHRKVNCETHFVDDDPAGAILDLADEVDADLIVVGSRGLGRGTRFIRGSVSSRIASHAKRSFLVVHDRGL